MRQLKIHQSITGRESLSIEKYLQEIGKVDLLTPEQEVKLAQQIKQGDQVALEKLVKANLRFVVSVAKQYQNKGLSLNDLINEGNLGLITAAQRFDETKGFKFISYAVWWIRQSILMALADSSRIVRLPLNKVTAYNTIQRVTGELMQELDREPTAEEIAEISGVSLEDASTLSSGGRHDSLDRPIGQDEGASVGDFLPDDTAIEKLEDYTERPTHNAALLQALGELSPRQKEIMILLFGLGGGVPMGLEDIGNKLGLTRERVRQLKDKTLKILTKNNTLQKLHYGEVVGGHITVTSVARRKKIAPIADNINNHTLLEHQKIFDEKFHKVFGFYFADLHGTTPSPALLRKIYALCFSRYASVSLPSKTSEKQIATILGFHNFSYYKTMKESIVSILKSDTADGISRGLGDLYNAEKDLNDNQKKYILINDIQKLETELGIAQKNTSILNDIVYNDHQLSHGDIVTQTTDVDKNSYFEEIQSLVKQYMPPASNDPLIDILIENFSKSTDFGSFQEWLNNTRKNNPQQKQSLLDSFYQTLCENIKSKKKQTVAQD